MKQVIRIAAGLSLVVAMSPSFGQTGPGSTGAAGSTGRRQRQTDRSRARRPRKTGSASTA